MLKIQKKISKYNYYTGNKVKYIVIHDVGTRSTAKNNVDYFAGGNRGASAHYFVDDISIWQSVEDKNGAWHVGDGYGAYGIDNMNSIGIEMCLPSGVITYKTELNTLELTLYLMKKYNIPASRVVRHYDASRKICPKQFSKNNWKRWKQFKKNIENGNMNGGGPIMLKPTQLLNRHGWVDINESRQVYNSIPKSKPSSYPKVIPPGSYFFNGVYDGADMGYDTFGNKLPFTQIYDTNGMKLLGYVPMYVNPNNPKADVYQEYERKTIKL